MYDETITMDWYVDDADDVWLCKPLLNLLSPPSKSFPQGQLQLRIYVVVVTYIYIYIVV